MSHSKVIKNTTAQRKSIVNNGKIAVKHRKEELRDQYVVPKDYVWKDCILHERRSAQTWLKTWNSFPNLTPVKPANITDHDDTKIKPLVIHYQRSSEMIGNYLRRQPFPFGESIINGKICHFPPKIRFVDEQYGHYRINRYLRNYPSTFESRYPVSKFIRHDVFPLLC